MESRSQTEPDETRCLELVKLEGEVSKSSTVPTICEHGPQFFAYPSYVQSPRQSLPRKSDPIWEEVGNNERE
jgi:hypothetical protein